MKYPKGKIICTSKPNNCAVRQNHTFYPNKYTKL